MFKNPSQVAQPDGRIGAGARPSDVWRGNCLEKNLTHECRIGVIVPVFYFYF